MEFPILNVQVKELCSYNAWNSHYLTHFNLNSGEVICHEMLELSKNFDYQIEIEYSIKLENNFFLFF